MHVLQNIIPIYNEAKGIDELISELVDVMKENNYENVTMLWRCICAARLQQAFTEKSREYLSE